MTAGSSLTAITRELERANDPILQFVRSVRPYKIPKGFMRWDTLSAVVSLAVSALNHPKFSQRDLATQFNAYRTALWFVQNAPVYCISTSLLRAFQESDVLEQKNVLADLRPPLPTLLILFPENSIKAPDGSCLNYCVIHLAEREHPERSRGSAYGLNVPYIPHEHDRNLHWSGVDNNETVWFSGAGLDLDGSVKFTEDSVGGADISREEHDFLKNMRSLIFQILLAFTYRPDLLEQPNDQIQTLPRRSHKANAVQPVVLHPRWLGRNYTRPSQPGRGTHASPKEHWRSGHWRRVVVGARELNQRRWTWIEPVFVGKTS